jgi:hypothetical protein
MRAFHKRGQAENMLFNRLMIERSGNFDEQEMCLEWVNHCDGKLIFPKLPFYMQDHYKSWKQNQAAQHQVDSTNFKKGAERLKNLNEDSAKSLPRPQVQVPWRMGEEIIAAAAPSDGIDVSTTSGGGKVIAGISIAAMCIQKCQNKFENQDSVPLTKGNKCRKSVTCASTAAVLASQRKSSIIGAYVLYA